MQTFCRCVITEGKTCDTQFLPQEGGIEGGGGIDPGSVVHAASKWLLILSNLC